MQTRKETNRHFSGSHPVVLGALFTLLGGIGLGCQSPQPDLLIITPDDGPNGPLTPDRFYTFQATLVQNGSSVRPGPTFTWTTSNPSIGDLTPQADGTARFLGLLKGTTTITATSAEISDSVEITVSLAGTNSITIMPTAPVLYAGASIPGAPCTADRDCQSASCGSSGTCAPFQLQAIAALKDGTTADRIQTVRLVSGATGVVTVSNTAGATKGRLTPVAPGTAVITADFPDTGVSATVPVTVTLPPP
jgi:hypothetical protein